MGYSKEIRDAAAAVIRDRKQNAERDAEYRREKIFEEIPKARQIEREIASCGSAAARAVLNGGDVKAELTKLKEKNLALQNALEQILAEKGYTTLDLEPIYSCTKCGDTGYYEKGNQTVKCECLKRAMVEAACNELNRQSPLSLSTFEDFSLDYYSHKIMEGYPRSPYDQMTMIYNYCKSYADNFTPDSESIIMRGKAGLGKTHLSLAIANNVIKRGYGVIYVSAPSIISKLEREHFSRNKDTDYLSPLLECDLLILDDLGTEFQSQFTSSTVYNIFNSRLLSGKPVIVSTNLSVSEMEKLYTERFVSRIFGQAKRLDFYGDRDIRIKKNS